MCRFPTMNKQMTMLENSGEMIILFKDILGR